MKPLSMKSKELLRKLILNAAETSPIKDPENLVETMRLKEDLFFDDVLLIELVVEIESSFDIQISDDIWDAVKTIKDVYITVQKHL